MRPSVASEVCARLHWPLVTWALVCTSAAGATPAIEMTPPQLIGGIAREHRWATVQVVLHNRGASEVAGRLVAHGEVVESVVYSRRLVLPPASRFRVQLYFRSLRSGTLSVQFDAQGDTLTDGELNLPVLRGERRLLLVVDQRGARLPFLMPRNADDNPRTGAVAGHSVPGDLPNRWIGYDAFDVVALHDVTATALSVQQRGALLDWVRSGGTVVACVGCFAQQYRDPFFEQLLGVRVSGSMVASEGPALIGPNGDEVRPTGRNLLVALTVSSGSAGRASEPVQLALERRIDCGRAVFVALDGSAADELVKPGWQELWTRVFIQDGSTFNWKAIEAAIPSRLEQLSGYQTPDLRLVWLAVGGFLLVAVQLNYAVFRKLRRLEYAWLAMVAMAIGFALTAHSMGLSSRGLAARRTAVTLVRTREHARVGRATTFLAVYSPTPADVEVGLSEGRSAVVPLEECGSVGFLETAPRGWRVEQADDMVLHAPNVRAASFTWCRFEHLVALPEPFAVERRGPSESESRYLFGPDPWVPSQFALVEGAKCFHGTPVSSGGSILGGPLPVMRTGVYHQLCQGLIGTAMTGRNPRPQHRLLSHIDLLQEPIRLAFGSVVGCTTKTAAIFNDGAAADPSVCWLFVDRRPPTARRARSIPVQLPIRTASSYGPFGDSQARDLAPLGRVRVTWCDDTVTALWRGRLEVPPGLRREWWRQLRLEVRPTGRCQGGVRAFVTVSDRNLPPVESGWLSAREGGKPDLTFGIPAERLPAAVSSDIRLEIQLGPAKTSGSQLRRGGADISAYLDVQIPARENQQPLNGDGP